MTCCSALRHTLCCFEHAHCRRRIPSVDWNCAPSHSPHAAYAEFQENEKGSITPGKLADMVLVSDDIFSIAPEKIRDVGVLKTFIGGRLVFDRDTTTRH